MLYNVVNYFRDIYINEINYLQIVNMPLIAIIWHNADKQLMQMPVKHFANLVESVA